MRRLVATHSRWKQPLTAARIRRWFRLAIVSVAMIRFREFGHDTERLGSREGGWYVPRVAFDQVGVAYCAGVGLDASFDVALAGRGWEVHSFDPTPRAIDYISSIEIPNTMRFHALGLWSSRATAKFYSPARHEDVSHSIMNLQGTDDYFEAPVLDLAAIMRSLGHKSVRLLKLDIEGAEHAVIARLLHDRLRPSAICVEFDQPASVGTVLRTCRLLYRKGYRCVRQDHWNFSFIYLPSVEHVCTRD